MSVGPQSGGSLGPVLAVAVALLPMHLPCMQSALEQAGLSAAAPAARKAGMSTSE